MSITSEPQLTTAPMVRPFPEPGRGLAHCYRELHLAANGTAEQKQAIGDLRMLPRPWDPTSIREPQLRRELWGWLDQVVAWLNLEYVWDVVGIIPPCWPQHPHIAHELPVLADQRYTAGQAFHSGALEEWHRYTLPLFLERMTARLGNRCVTRHEAWPAAPRYRAFTLPQATSDRSARFDADTATPRRHLAVVDLDTGDVIRPAKDLDHHQIGDQLRDQPGGQR